MIDITIGILKLRKRKKYKYDGIDGIQLDLRISVVIKM